MSTGAKHAKRHKTIDAFFVPKKSKNLLGVELPREGVAALCAMDSGAEDEKNDAVEPLAARPSDSQRNTKPHAAAPAAKQRATAAGLKRRNRQDSPGLDAGAGQEAQDGAEGAPPGALSAAVAAAEAAAAVMATLAAAGGVAAAAAAAAAAEGAEDGASGDAGAQQAQHQQQQQQGPQREEQEQSATPDDDGLTPAQRAQVAANRNRALARRAVSEAAAPGAPPLQLSSLLVEESWRDALGADLTGANLKQLEAFLHGEWGRKPVFPPRDCIFQAFNACPLDQVRVVVLGQDPYHGPGQAMGLSFSVPREVRPLPPSLLNIYKEAAADLGWPDRPQHGDLSAWSVQGVLLLNTCLTVRQGEANSHAKRGWEQFTDAAIRTLSARRSGVVFLLWGKPAEAKANLVDTRKHHVLKAPHPSPLSASRGFFGCRHFSKANQLLEAQGLQPIDWRPS